MTTYEHFKPPFLLAVNRVLGKQKLVEYDRKQRAQSVASVSVSYTPETPQRDDRQFEI